VNVGSGVVMTLQVIALMMSIQKLSIPLSVNGLRKLKSKFMLSASVRLLVHLALNKTWVWTLEMQFTHSLVLRLCCTRVTLVVLFVWRHSLTYIGIHEPDLSSLYMNIAAIRLHGTMLVA